MEQDMRIISKLALRPTLIVDLDRNTLESVGEIECVALPGMTSKLRSKLGHVASQGVLSDRVKKGLNNFLGKALDMDQIMCSDAIYALWMTFYIFTFGSWRKYIDLDTSGAHQFNIAKLLDSAKNSCEEELIFFERFCHTRMFHAFTQEVIKHCQSSLSGDANDFCRLCSIVSRKDSLDQNLGFYNVMEALKNEMYPSRTGRIAATALELTSSTPSTVDKSSTLSILSQASFSSLGLREIFSVVKYRLSDCEGRSWRHASLTFELLQTLLNIGSDAVLSILRDSTSQLLQFSQYTHKEEETQNTIRLQAENLIRIVFDLTEQSKRRTKNYYCVPDSLVPFKVRLPSLKSQSTEESLIRTENQVHTEIIPNSDHKKFFKEFHNSARKSLIENANVTWFRYREKSIVKGRSRILPKFAKLHKKLALESATGATISSQFEDLLDLQFAQSIVDFGSLNNTAIQNIPSSVLPSDDFAWLSSTAAPNSQGHSQSDFMLELLNGSSGALKSDADSSQSKANNSLKGDPFEGLFK